jgi:hypothetical protein
MAVTMKDGIFLDVNRVAIIRTDVPEERRILQVPYGVTSQTTAFFRNIACPDTSFHVRFEDFTAVTMKNAVFWNVTQCGSCKNRRFEGMSVLTRATQRNIPEVGILHYLLCFSLI